MRGGSGSTERSWPWIKHPALTKSSESISSWGEGLTTEKPSLEGMFLWFDLLFSLVWPFSLLRGPGDVIPDCKIQFLDEIYQVEKPGARPLSAVDGQFKRTTRMRWFKATPWCSFCPLTCTHGFLTPGKSGPECKHCKADPDSECRFCSCCVCGGKQDASMQLLCDECNMAFHIYCLNPPLTTIPDDEDWWDERKCH